MSQKKTENTYIRIDTEIICDLCNNVIYKDEGYDTDPLSKHNAIKLSNDIDVHPGCVLTLVYENKGTLSNDK